MILLFVLWRINAVLPDITIGTWKLKLQETTTSNISTQVSVYDVTYHLEGGDNSILNPTQLSTEVSFPIELWSPKKEGYNFSGWYQDGKYTTEIRYLTEARNYDLYAKWTRHIDNVVNVENYPYEQYGRTRWKALKELNYSFWYEINIPGNPVTKLKDYKNHIIDSRNQCPQGLCMTEKYVIVTSYSVDEKKALGTMAFYDRITGNHVKTL